MYIYVLFWLLEIKQCVFEMNMHAHHNFCLPPRKTWSVKDPSIRDTYKITMIDKCVMEYEWYFKQYYVAVLLFSLRLLFENKIFHALQNNTHWWFMYTHPRFYNLMVLITYIIGLNAAPRIIKINVTKFKGTCIKFKSSPRSTSMVASNTLHVLVISIRFCYQHTANKMCIILNDCVLHID